jgi:hypothetical protein
MKYQRQILILSLLAVVALSPAALAQLGPPGGMIYANDELFRTIVTPANLPDHGNFDTIYVLGHSLVNVADAAPGDIDYNGGRWEVRPIEFLTIAPTQYTNATQIHDAAMAGEISIGSVVRRFECPLIPLR